MELAKELERLIKEPMRDEDAVHDRIFWRLVDICLAMAKRIEALEQREYGHLRRAGKLVPRNDQG